MADGWRKLVTLVGAGLTRWVELLARAEPAYAVAGPLFEKELRVAGRRARTYILRFVYLGILAGFVAMEWLSLVSVQAATGSTAYYLYSMPTAGRAIITTIVWFQFVVLQFVALVMLSTSISDEIYHRTLGVLMTTPITSLQIVLGKLLGKLLQLVLLLAISLPMLLLTQTLGGVPWRFVFAGLGVTLTTVVLAGTVSMYFSISSRRSPILVILKSLAALAVLFVLVPFVCLALSPKVSDPAWLESAYVHANPYLVMSVLSTELFSPGTGFPFALHWWVNCLVSLALAAAILGVCVVRVRRSAMNQLVGDPGGWFGRRRSDPTRPGRIRRVRGSPVIWKELHASLLKSRVLGILGWVAMFGILVATYLPAGDDLVYGETHIVYGVCLLLFAGLSAAVIAATGIAREREAGTWPLLLVTPLDDAQIVTGKALALIRRTGPAWGLLGLHCAVFTVAGYMHPVVLVHVALLVAGLVALLTGSGLFFSTCVRRSTYAVLLNLGLCVVLWFAVPVLVSVVMGMILMFTSMATQGRTGPEVLLLYYSTHPLWQIGFIMAGGAGMAEAAKGLADLTYDFGMRGPAGVLSFTLIVTLVAVLHGGLGWAFASWATRRLRRNVF